MKVSIDVATSTFVRFWLVVIGFGLAGLMIYSARTALIILGTALFLAIALNTPVGILAKRIPGRPGRSRILSTAIAFLTVITVIGGFLYFATPPIVQQTVKFAQTVPGIVEDVTTSWRALDDVVQRYGLQSQVDSAIQSVQNSTSQLASDAGRNLISGIGSLFGFMASLFLTLVLAFLMLVEGPLWMRRIWGLYHDDGLVIRHKRAVGRMYGVVNGFVTGQITVSGIGAVLSGLAVFLLSLFIFEVEANLAIPIAVITFVFTLIPMFGSTVAAILAALLLAVASLPAAIIYVIYFVIYQQIENNFISPVIQAKRVDLSPLAVLASVTIGLYMFGLIGGIISIPIAGIIKVLIEEYMDHAKIKRAHDNKPLHKLAKKIRES